MNNRISKEDADRIMNASDGELVCIETPEEAWKDGVALPKRTVSIVMKDGILLGCGSDVYALMVATKAEVGKPDFEKDYISTGVPMPAFDDFICGPPQTIMMSNVSDPSIWEHIDSQDIPKRTCTCPAFDMLRDGWTCTCGAKE